MFNGKTYTEKNITAVLEHAWSNAFVCFVYYQTSPIRLHLTMVLVLFFNFVFCTKMCHNNYVSVKLSNQLFCPVIKSLFTDNLTFYMIYVMCNAYFAYEGVFLENPFIMFASMLILWRSKEELTHQCQQETTARAYHRHATCTQPESKSNNTLKSFMSETKYV